MNQAHKTALTYHCRLAVETVHPRFRSALGRGLSRVLTVNSGYE